jgi:riboflavin synthase alpha subunit
MRIGFGSISVGLLLLAGCGSGTAAPQLAGATIEGKFLNGSQALRVEVPGTSISATPSASGSFLLAQVPAGASALHFKGPGTDATLAIERVVRDEYRRLRVTLSGNQAQEECERTETEFHGQVTAIDGTTLTVGDRTVTVTDATVIRQNGANVALSAIAVGSFVEIDGALQADGTVLARRISIEDEKHVADALVGTLTPIQLTDSGSKLTVGGVLVNITVNTEILRGDVKVDASALKIGDRLLVRGQVQADQSIAATQVRVLVDDDQEEEDFHVTGDVTAVSADKGTFSIGDTLISVDAHTQFEGFGGPASLADLKVGDRVDAEVVKQADGSLLAKEVRRFQPPQPPSPAILAVGAIEAVSGSSITVATIAFSVSSQTVIRRGDATVALSDLKVGDSVLVKGRPGTAGPVADVILVATGQPPDELVAAVGPIEAVGTDSVTVAGKLFKVDTNTVIARGRMNVSLASLAVGETAEVKAAVSSDGSLVAQLVRVQASK